MNNYDWIQIIILFSCDICVISVNLRVIIMAIIEEIDKYCSLCMDINCTGCEYHDVHFRNVKKNWYDNN